MTDDVRGLLKQVVLATAQSTMEAVGSGVLQKEDQDFIVWEGDGVWASTNRETLAIWNDSEIQSIAQKKQEEFGKLLEMCAKTMAESVGRKMETIRGELRQFLLAVVRRSADELSTRSVEEMIGQLIHEVSGGATDWTGVVWISGIVAAESPIQVKHGITLRRPEPRDFSRRMPANMYGFPHNPLLSPDSILECSFLAPEPPDRSQIISALSLYRAAPVKEFLHHWKNNSVVRRTDNFSCDLVKPSAPDLPPPELSNADSVKLGLFVQAAADKLPLKPLGLL